MTPELLKQIKEEYDSFIFMGDFKSKKEIDIEYKGSLQRIIAHCHTIIEYLGATYGIDPKKILQYMLDLYKHELLVKEAKRVFGDKHRK